MKINGLSYDEDQNIHQDAGELDRQIQEGLQALEAALEQEPDSRDRQKKLAWARRLLETAKDADRSVPDRISEDEWNAMHPLRRIKAVTDIAARETARIRPYSPGTVSVERQSFHPADWYIWSVAAQRDSDGREWDCWTLNLTTGSMNGGRYGLTERGLREALSSKRGVEACRPDTCRFMDDKKEE